MIVEENVQQPRPFFRKYPVTKMYARKGVINAYLQISLLDLIHSNTFKAFVMYYLVY